MVSSVSRRSVYLRRSWRNSLMRPTILDIAWSAFSLITCFIPIIGEFSTWRDRFVACQGLPPGTTDTAGGLPNDKPRHVVPSSGGAHAKPAERSQVLPVSG